MRNLHVGRIRKDRSSEGWPVRPVVWVAVAICIAFTAVIWLMDPLLDRFPHLPDQGPAWYYWQLPRPELWARVTAWAFYALHQLAMWYIVYRALKEEPHPDRVSRLNLVALGINFLFMVLHLLQTHLWYDGLAQDVPIFTSQDSVIVMLVIVLLLLIPRRGIFWGLKPKIPERVMAFLQKGHGYYIAWALVYTFWFHPMEGDYGILAGFFYMFLLFIQLSMFNTRIHFSVPWITLLEFFVGVHGPLIAVMNGQAIWPMFLFGFLFMTVNTQIHGLPIPRWSRWPILAIYVVAVAWVYRGRGYGRLFEISFIPAALYGGTFALALLVGFGVWIASRRVGKKA